MLPEYLRYTPHGAAHEGAVVSCDGCRITVLTDRLLRLEQGNTTDEATLTVIERDLGKTPFSVKTENGVLTLKTAALVLTYTLGAAFSADTLSVRLLTKPYTAWHYGDSSLGNLGGTISTLDQMNGACPIDDGICSVDGFAVIDDSRTPLMDENGWFAVRNETVDLYFFGYGHDYEACVKDYYRLTGKPSMIPAFALGNWWSRYFRYTEDSYLGLMDTFKENDIPVAVSIVDMDWHVTDGGGVRDTRSEGWTGYTWNKDLFPDYKRFLKGIKDRNLHTALNLHPASGVREWDDQYEEMGKFLGVDTSKKQPIPFNCLSEKFWQAYFEVLHFPYEKDGVDFWWMDWQQGFDYRWIHPYDPTVNPLECMSPLWMVNHMHYMASCRDNKRGLIFSRYAGFGSQRYPIGFSGDTIISWESLDFQPYFTATASNIGYSYWSHDIGGHMGGGKDDELNARWIQFGVFSPIFRLHSSNSPFSGREYWNYEARSAAVVKEFMRLRHQLFPYLYTMTRRNCEDLIPTIRPMYHTHPEEREAYKVKNQYWFGSELIAAPITRKADRVSGLAFSTVWLPDGVWTDWFTGYVYHGGKTVDMHRPLEQMPLLCKAGAIVPLQAHIPHDNHLGKAETLEVVIAAGGSNTFTLYEDDGESTDYRNGAFCETKMAIDWEEKSASFTVSPVSGDTSLIPAVRTYRLRFKGFAKNSTFTQNGKPLDCEYRAADNSYLVTVTDIAATDGFTVCVENETALLHDNGDYYDRILNLLTHSQCYLSLINHRIKRVDETRKTGLIDRIHFIDGGEDRTLAAIYELLAETGFKTVMEPPPGIPLEFL